MGAMLPQLLLPDSQGGFEPPLHELLRPLHLRRGDGSGEKEKAPGGADQLFEEAPSFFRRNVFQDIEREDSVEGPVPEGKRRPVTAGVVHPRRLLKVHGLYPLPGKEEGERGQKLPRAPPGHPTNVQKGEGRGGEALMAESENLLGDTVPLHHVEGQRGDFRVHLETLQVPEIRKRPIPAHPPVLSRT